MSTQARKHFAEVQLNRLPSLSDSEAKGNISGTREAKKQQGGAGRKKFRPGSVIGVFDLYILQKRRSWGKFRPGSSRHQNMYPFFAIRGGLGKISAKSGQNGKKRHYI